MSWRSTNKRSVRRYFNETDFRSLKWMVNFNIGYTNWLISLIVRMSWKATMWKLKKNWLSTKIYTTDKMSNFIIDYTSWFIFLTICMSRKTTKQEIHKMFNHNNLEGRDWITAHQNCLRHSTLCILRVTDSWFMTSGKTGSRLKSNSISNKGRNPNLQIVKPQGRDKMWQTSCEGD